MKSKHLLLLLGLSFNVFFVESSYPRSFLANSTIRGQSLATSPATPPPSLSPVLPQQGDTTFLRNAWGVDLLISSGGVGLGGFYRRQLSETIYGFASFSISEAKDDREIEFVDPFTFQKFTPGKINRFLVLPLLFGAQYRLFRDAILENFRPYLTAAMGPSIVYTSPYVEREEISPGVTRTRQIDFFKALGRGQAHYTVGGYVGIGAFFGFERKSLVGINLRYYFVPIQGGIESLEDVKKKDFGGFFITLNFGTQY